MEQKIYDTIIIGGGPAAVAAGVYAARKQMVAALFANQIGGQSVVSDGIENWIGEQHISGPDLAIKLKNHIQAQKDAIDLFLGMTVDAVAPGERGMFVVTANGQKYVTKTVILATGGRHRRLGVPGEADFEGKGVAFCATCDAPFFRDKHVAVVGAGNSGLEAAVDLLAYASKIYVVARKASQSELRGDPVTQRKVLASKKVTMIYGAEATAVVGDRMVTGLRYRDLATGAEHAIDVGGIFVEIGSVPNSEIVGDFVPKDEGGNVIVDPATQATGCPGIFAAGDVTTTLYRQNNIAAGDAIKALLSAYAYVTKKQS